MKSKYLLLSLTFLILFQLFDYVFFSLGLFVINGRLVFGNCGGNSLAIAVSAIFFLILYFVVPKNKTILPIIVVLLAGIASNIIDRLIYGGVVDYLNIWIIPVFNLADVAIVLSIILIFWHLLKKSQ